MRSNPCDGDLDGLQNTLHIAQNFPIRKTHNYQAIRFKL